VIPLANGGAAELIQPSCLAKDVVIRLWESASQTSFLWASAIRHAVEKIQYQ
jgi:hypothetical protein